MKFYLKKIIALAAIIISTSNSQNVPESCQPDAAFEYYISINSTQTGKFLNPLDPDYAWVNFDNSLNTIPLSQFDEVRNHFFFDYHRYGLISNEYYFEHFNLGNSNLEPPKFSLLTNGYGNNVGKFLTENQVTGDTLYSNIPSTIWQINYLNKPSTLGSYGTLAFKWISIRSLETGKWLDASHSTWKHQESYNPTAGNKPIRFSTVEENSTLGMNTAFQLVPVDNGKVAIRDYYTNYLSSDNSATAHTYQELTSSEKLTLEPVDASLGKYLINTPNGYIRELYDGSILFNQDQSLATVFVFALRFPIC